MKQNAITRLYEFVYSDTHKQQGSHSEVEAWLDIIFSVSHSSKPLTNVFRGRTVSWSYAEWPASIRFLSSRWKWSMRRVRTFLAVLVANDIISIRKSGGMNIIHLQVEYPPHKPTLDFVFNDPEETSSGIPGGTTTGTFTGTTTSQAKKEDDALEAKEIQSHQTTFQEPSAAQSRHNGGTKNNRNNIINNDNDTCARKSIQDEVHEMSANQSWREAICMRHHITQQQLDSHLEFFATDCVCQGREAHRDMPDALCHFSHWLRIQLQNNPSRKSSTFSNQNIQYHGNHISKPTSTDYIRDAQEWAIRQSQDFIRQAEKRHGDI